MYSPFPYGKQYCVKGVVSRDSLSMTQGQLRSRMDISPLGLEVSRIFFLQSVLEVGSGADC